MSQIGPNLASSIVGGLASQQRAGESRQATETSNTQRGAFKDQLTEEINNDDLDNQVDSDAEGRGSQGRSFSEQQDLPAAETDDSSEKPSSGLDMTA